jgi:hypothetical protein
MRPGIDGLVVRRVLLENPWAVMNLVAGKGCLIQRMFGEAAVYLQDKVVGLVAPGGRIGGLSSSRR